MSIKINKIQITRFIFLLNLALAGCSSSSSIVNRGSDSYTPEFFGGVAADEPIAAMEGQKILSAGGNAVDAATALYFVLAVTLPSKASLGGGGACMVFDPKTKTIKAIDFLSRTASETARIASVHSTVPGNPLGVFALHARYGSFKWSRLLAVGEKLARFGFPASRTLVNDIVQLPSMLAAYPGSRKIFYKKNGKRISEGTLIKQLDLATSISSLRLNGPNGFYRGRFARLFVRSSSDIGGSISIEDMKTFKPEWRDVISKKYGLHEINFMPLPSTGGLIAAQIFGMLDKSNVFEDASDNQKYHILAELGSFAFVDSLRWLEDGFPISQNMNSIISQVHLNELSRLFRLDRHVSPTFSQPMPKKQLVNSVPSTSFVVVDRYGLAVACSFTMNNNFGVGRMAKGTGIMLASASKGPGVLGPIIVRNKNSNNFIFAGVASGGISPPMSLMNIFGRTMIAGESLKHAISAVRVYNSGVPDITFYEPLMGETSKDFLKNRGHYLKVTPIISVVNAVHCSEGLPRASETCAIISDPRGSGLATEVSQ
jgi:gamma-glutamyltranspeptidase/glutathione hydrolase